LEGNGWNYVTCYCHTDVPNVIQLAFFPEDRGTNVKGIRKLADFT